MEFILSLLIPTLLFPKQVVADVEPVHQEIQIVETIPEPEPVILPPRPNEEFARFLIDEYANRYSVSASLMYKIVACETGNTFDPLIQSFAIRKDGTRENSWGLAQIHLPAHPNVTKEQAQDPDFAINFLASNISKGNAHIWTCWHILREEGKL